jgi:hypothetical protein
METLAHALHGFDEESVKKYRELSKMGRALFTASMVEACR